MPIPDGISVPTCCVLACLPACRPACLPACLRACLPGRLPVCLPAGMHACYPSSCRFVLLVAWKLNGDSHPTPSRVQDRTARGDGKAIDCEIVRDSDGEKERARKEGMKGYKERQGW